MIDTVRETRIFSKKGYTTSAEFILSKFKLHVRVHLTAVPNSNTISFQLDPHCKLAGKNVLKEVRTCFSH